MVVVLGILVGVGAMSWQWVQSQLSGAITTLPDQQEDDLLTGAIDAFNRGDLNTAIATAREVLARQPNRPEAVIVLARSLVYRSYNDYNRSSDRQTALELTGTAVARNPRNADVLAIHAFVQSATGNPAAAAETAEKALEINPTHGLAQASLGLAYGSAGSFEIAMRESQRAVEMGNWLLDGNRALAISYSDQGNYQTALDTLARAQQINPQLTPLYFEEALYALQLGDADRATHAYYQVLTFDPNNVKARLRLCELSSTMRERATAIRYCTEVTERAPSWADGWYQLGREYFLQGDFAAAQEHLHRCSTLQVLQSVPVSERRFECWYLQGQAAEILGDCPALLTIYNEFRSMTAEESVQQTWTYPPEGPPGCAPTMTTG